MLARFLYFIPNVNGCSEVMLQSLGLHDRFIGPGGRLAAWVAREWEGGPENLNGCLIASGNRPPAYTPESQTWLRVECPNAKPSFYFVSLENNMNRPGPSDLEYPTLLNGHLVKLGDGNYWRVPLVLRWDTVECKHVPAMPQRFARRPVNGIPQLVRETQPIYQPLEAIAQRIWDSYLNGTPLPQDQVFDDAVTLLSVNFRIGMDVVGLLGLLDLDLAKAVLASAIDIPSLKAQAAEICDQGLISGHQREDFDEMKMGELNRG